MKSWNVTLSNGGEVPGYVECEVVAENASMAIDIALAKQGSWWKVIGCVPVRREDK